MAGSLARCSPTLFLIITLQWSFAAPAWNNLSPQLNLLIVGDAGFSAPEKRTPGQQRTARAMANYVRNSGLNFAAVLVAGDNFKVKLADPDDPQFRQGFEEMYDPTLLKMPFYAIFGAHDYEYGAAAAELAYPSAHPNSRWKMPGRWYRLDLPAAAPLVSLLLLDTTREFLSDQQWRDQLQWLERELTQPRRSPWTVCVGHQPLFSGGQHGDSAAMQTALGPLLRKHRADFYISGHDHVLQHLQLPDWPTTFLISGGGGENINRPLTKRRGEFLRAVHGFASMEFTPSSTVIKLLDDTSTVLYGFERSRNGSIHSLSSKEARTDLGQ